MLQLSPHIGKLPDKRLIDLLNGRMSLSTFVLSLQTPDYYVLDGDIIKPVPQYQYQALVQYDVSQLHKKQIFAQQVIQGVYDDKLSHDTLQQLNRLRLQYANCKTCQKNKYRSQISDLVSQQLSQLLASYSASIAPVQHRQYPHTTQQIPAVLSLNYMQQQIGRKPCIDCVQKHIGQAYITAMQARMGYPQHLILCFGHLAQAIQQCPAQAQILKKQLIFCLGYSRKNRTGFVPLNCLLPALQKARKQLTGTQAAVQNKQDTAYTLQLKVTAQQIKNIPAHKISQLLMLCRLSETYAKGVEQNQAINIVRWQGAMARISQILQQYVSTQAGNTVRNIRLMFRAAPQYIIGTEYSMQDLTKVLQQILQEQPATSDTTESGV